MPSPRGPEPYSLPKIPQPRRRRIGLRILLTVLALLLAVFIGFYGHIYYETHMGTELPAIFQLLENGGGEVVPVSDNGVVSVGHIEEIIQPASELITTKYYYTDADIFEDYKQLLGYRLPFTTNKTVFTYEGVVGIGFDFSKIIIEIDSIQHEVSLTFPDMQIVSNEISADSFQYFDVSNSVFNQTEMGDITELIAVLKEKTAERVLQDEDLLAQAKDNAEQILLGFLRASDLMQSYTVTFRS